MTFWTIIIGAFCLGFLALPAKCGFQRIRKRRAASKHHDECNQVVVCCAHCKKNMCSCKPCGCDHKAIARQQLEKYYDNMKMADLRQYRKKMEETNEESFRCPPSFDKWYKPNEDHDTIRILPQAPRALFADTYYADLRWRDVDNKKPWYVQRFQHYLGTDNVVQCPDNGKCPICALNDKLRFGSDADEKTKELHRQIKPLARYYFNVYVPDEDRVAIWSAPHSVYQQVCLLLMDTHFDLCHPLNGHDLKIMREPVAGMPPTIKRYKVIPTPPRPLSDTGGDIEWILAQMWDLEEVVKSFEKSEEEVKAALDKFLRKNNIELVQKGGEFPHNSRYRYPKRCNECFGPLEGYAGQKYCSAECEKAASDRVANSPYGSIYNSSKVTNKKTCTHCGEEFIPLSGNNSEYCSVECYGNHHSHECIKCGNKFFETKTMLTCPRCRDKARQKQPPQWCKELFP